MKVLKTLCVALSLLSLLACNKEDEPQQTSVNGQVRINGTESPIHTGLPLAITLVERYSGEGGGTFGGGGAATREIATTTTDSLGNFSFSFKGKSSSTFYLEPQSVPAPYNFWDDVAGLIDCCRIIAGKNQTKHLYFGPPGWLKLRFFNGGPVYLGDYIYYRLGNTDGRVYGPTDINPDSVVVIRTSGNVEPQVAFNLYRAGKDSIWIQRYFVPAFDTAYYEVHY
jgi:hypothetical protein